MENMLSIILFAHVYVFLICKICENGQSIRYIEILLTPKDA